ncbi:MAG: hypothetical protein AABY22_10600, partial [Nanoarchaeota archaeon]
RECLERGVISTTEQLVQGSPQVLFQLDETKGDGGIDYTDDGIFVYHKELLFPKKGFPYPAACQANNIVKRAFTGAIRAFAKNPLMVVFLLRTKTLEKFLNEFCSFAEITLSPYFWKPQYYSKTSKEINKFIKVFLKEIGVKCESLGKIVAHFFEFDDAYMFRLQDIMNETTKEALANLAKEILRLFGIFNERESRASMKEKTAGIALLIRLALFIPRFRRAFKKALAESQFTNFQMDILDKYQVLRWDNSYKFLGRTQEDRVGEFLNMHKGVLPKFNIINVQ